MTDIVENPRVPARLVLLSLAALWTCYFAVATLRGAFIGFDFAWPIVSRRLTICIVSMLVMASVWPLLQMLDRKSNLVRLLVVLVGALPLAFVLSFINNVIFADIEVTKSQAQDVIEDPSGKVRITRDDAGNILVDLPKAARSSSQPMDESSQAAEDLAPVMEDDGSGITIHTRSTRDKSYTRLDALADNAFGRYFLVLAWAALYFALAKAEEARAAERRESEYRRAAEAAELRSLRYQVNPHFLFNTLNSLSALVMTGRKEDAELQKLYFAIEAVRFPNRLLTQIDIDPDAIDAMVPGMILQPLVENSVKYAVAATQRPVTVSINARREGGQLVLTVGDDGPGAERSKAEGCGIGLANVRDRLKARFGGAGTLKFGKRPEGGFETELRMPLELGRV